MFPGGSQGYLTAAANLGTALAVAGLGPVTSVSNGIASKHNAFSFGEDGILLRANDRVEVDFFAATAFNMLATAVGGVGTTIMVWLDGIRLRNVA
jgi:hypothetical protein